jgi:cobalt-zinc-cadmium efflux system membrane fusion protein
LGVLVGAGGLYFARASIWANRAGESGNVGHPHGKASEKGHDKHEGEEGIVHLSHDKIKSADIQTAPVQHGTMEVITWLTGKVTINQDRLAHVSSRVTGIAREVPGKLGQAVKAGDVLAVVDSTEVGNAKLEFLEKDLAATFARANFDWTDTIYRNTKELIEALEKETPIAELEQAFAGKIIGEHREQLLSAYAKLNLARADFARKSGLTEKGITSDADRIKAKADLEAAQATYSAWLEQLRFTAERDHLKAEQELRKAETARMVGRERLAILGYRPSDLQPLEPYSATQDSPESLAVYPIRSPFTGTIIDKHIVLSEQVEPETTLFSIADLASVWVDVDVYEKDFDLLPQVRDIKDDHSHRTLILHSDAYPARQFTAEVFYTGDVVDDTTRTIRLKAAAENPDRVLKPGTFVRVGLAGRHLEDALRVPSSAVLSQEGKSFVFVQKELGEYERRAVVIGFSNDGEVEVREGLKPDELVVVAGAFALKSEMMRSKLAEGGHHH